MTDSKNNFSTIAVEFKIIARTAAKYFNYYWSRNVSGLFKLNKDESEIKDKFFAKLELFTHIAFTNGVT